MYLRGQATDLQGVEPQYQAFNVAVFFIIISLLRSITTYSVLINDYFPAK